MACEPHSRPLWWLGTLFALGLVALACGDSTVNVAECSADSDCPRNERCSDGLCVAQCTEDDDCPEGPCVAGRCTASPPAATGSLDDVSSGASSTPDLPDAEPTPSGNASTSNDAPSSSTPSESPPSNPGPDTPPERIPLEVVDMNPGIGSRGAPLDFTARVRFNQDLDATSFAGGANLDLRDAAGRPVPFLSNADPDEADILVMRPAPDAVIHPSSHHEIRINTNVRGVTGGRLAAPARLGFTTRPMDGLSTREAWARHYAPILLQEATTPRIDTITRIDFDGDLDARNNLANSTGPQEAWVYWALASTPTHVLIHYMLYYPGVVRNPRISTTPDSHHMTGILVIVRRTDEPFGQLEAAVTNWAGDESNEHTWAPPTGRDPMGGLQGPGVEGRLNAADLEDGHRVTFFLTSGNHALCPPSETSLVGSLGCRAAAGSNAPFGNGNGWELRPGEAPQTPTATGRGPWTYGLLPMETDFWGLRHLYGNAGDVFEAMAAYGPPAGRPPIAEDDGPPPLLVPASLSAPPGTDNDGVRPFQWGGTGVRGTWLVDPAHYIDSRNWSLPEPFDTDYCFNAFLEIAEPDACPDLWATEEDPSEAPVTDSPPTTPAGSNP